MTHISVELPEGGGGRSSVCGPERRGGGGTLKMYSGKGLTLNANIAPHGAARCTEQHRNSTRNGHTGADAHHAVYSSSVALVTNRVVCTFLLRLSHPVPHGVTLALGLHFRPPAAGYSRTEHALYNSLLCNMAMNVTSAVRFYVDKIVSDPKISGMHIFSCPGERYFDTVGCRRL